MEILDQHCEDVGRDPADIERSAVAMLILSDDDAVLEKMRAREHAMPTNVGNVEEIRQIVGAYAEAGVDELIVPAFNLGPRERALDVLDQFIEDVVPVGR